MKNCSKFVLSTNENKSLWKRKNKGNAKPERQEYSTIFLFFSIIKTVNLIMKTWKTEIFINEECTNQSVAMITMKKEEF